MALTEQDRDSIKLMATEIAVAFHREQKSSMKEMATANIAAVNALIEHHQSNCPYGRRLLESKWFLAGAGALIIVLSAGGNGLWQLVSKFL